VADGPIRTTRGPGGPRSLKVVHFETLTQPDGTYLVQASGGLDIKGTGRTPELALEAAQQAQMTVMTQDSMGGNGFRTVTAEQLGIVKP
jgi:hypothetical protein